MKKPLVILDQDEEVKKASDKIEEAQKQFKESEAFLFKQHKELHNRTVKPAWEEMEAILKEKNYMAEFDDNKHLLSIDNGIVWIQDRDHKDIPDFIKMLGGIISRDES